MKQVLCESALQRRKGFVAFTFEEELGRKSTYIVLCSIIFKRNRKYSSSFSRYPHLAPRINHGGY